MGVTVALSAPLSKLTIFKFSTIFYFLDLLQKLSQTRPLKTVMKTIITQPMAHAVQFTRIWLNQLHEKYLTGVKVQNFPFQCVGELRFCHNSGFSPPSFISSHILPYPPQHRAPPSLHFLWVASPPTQLIHPRRPCPRK